MEVKLIIRDEVNIKLEGLPLEARKKLSNKFKYQIPHARYHPAYKLGRWDGMISLFSIGGEGYLSQIETILEILNSMKIEITQIEDLRKPIDLNFKPITENYWIEQGVVWPQGHQAAGKPIMLRDYQVEAINKFLTNPQALQELATSSGKTIITATLSHICESIGRTLTIVPNKSLVEQTEEDFINVGLDVGVYYGDRKDLFKTHTICTWQSLEVLNKKSKRHDPDIMTLSQFLEGVKVIIIDECHRSSAEILRNLLTRNLTNAPIRWGLTGTVPKLPYEYESIFASIGPVIGGIKAYELQEQGVLSNCHVYIKQLIDLVEFKSYAEELKYLVTETGRIEYIARLVKDLVKSGNTFVLVDRIESGNRLLSYLESDTDVTFVSGSVKTKTRKEAYDTVKIADNKIIIATYGVASTGINIPRIFNLVLLEPGKSFTRVIQSIGRGLRKANDKDHVNIYDISSTCRYSKKHLLERRRYYSEAHYPFTIEKIDWKAS